MQQVPGGLGLHHHEVGFHDDDDEMVDRVARYVAGGVVAGGRAVVLVTRAHAVALDEALVRLGVDPVRSRASGQFVVHDAQTVLDTFTAGGVVDARRFASLDVVDAAFRDGRPVRFFGEMVALLWEQGDVVGALDLESAWNDLAARRQFSLLCAYPTRLLHPSRVGDVSAICQRHTAVHPPLSYHRAGPWTGEAAREHTEVFVATPQAVAAARRIVQDVLSGWGLTDDVVNDAILVTSEIATNAVSHAGSAFRISLSRHPDVVRIEIEDAGPGEPETRVATRDEQEGRGLAIIAALSMRWGCDAIPDGKVVWSELEVAGVA